MTTSTSSLLRSAAAAGPLWLTVSLTQAATRPGFDITRHPVSVLSNGDLGWIQITNFLTAGVLTFAGAVGARRQLRGGPARTWAPILLAVQGTGLAVAAVFRLDPLDGFPPGTPTGAPSSMSAHSMVHNIAGSCTFAAMIAVCFVLARHFTATEKRGWATGGRCAGLLFAAGLIWAYTGRPAGALTLFAGVSIAWIWIAASLTQLTTYPRKDRHGQFDERTRRVPPLDREEVRPAHQ